MKNVWLVIGFLARRVSRSKILWAVFIFVFLAISGKPQESILDRKISLQNQRTTIYEALNEISDSIGYFFIYDSKVVNSDKKIRVSASNLPLYSVLNSILSDNTLAYRAFGNHILIYKKGSSEVPQTSAATNESKVNIIIRGQVFDAQTKQPIPFATAGIPELNLGNITNNDGLFVLKVPKEYINSCIVISHIGYKSKKLPIELLSNDKADVYLDIEHISIQEVIIRNVDPLSIVREAIERIPQNYINIPSYLTTFYREGVKQNNKYVNYSEAVFRVYKSAYSGKIDSDQLKLLKSRRIQNIDQSDTIVVKLKGGLNSCLVLDIIKNYPTFLDPEFYELYNYFRSDITTIDDRSAYVIEFAQKENIFEPLLKGVVYIDMDNLSILGANFQINPDYVARAADLLVVKKNRKYIIKPERINYSVRYKQINGNYYVSHIRGDLSFRYRKKRQLLTNSFTAFMEMATSNIDTVDVKRFDRRETEKTTDVFSDNSYDYDNAFWIDFNHIEPEENLYDALSKINSKIEQIVPRD